MATFPWQLNIGIVSFRLCYFIFLLLKADTADIFAKTSLEVLKIAQTEGTVILECLSVLILESCYEN